MEVSEDLVFRLGGISDLEKLVLVTLGDLPVSKLSNLFNNNNNNNHKAHLDLEFYQRDNYKRKFKRRRIVPYSPSVLPVETVYAPCEEDDDNIVHKHDEESLDVDDQFLIKRFLLETEPMQQLIGVDSKIWSFDFDNNGERDYADDNDEYHCVGKSSPSSESGCKKSPVSEKRVGKKKSSESPTGELNELMNVDHNKVSFQGHIYKKSRNIGKIGIYYICNVYFVYGCRVSICTRNQEGKFWLRGQHNHPPNINQIRHRIVSSGQAEADGDMMDITYLENKKILIKGQSYRKLTAESKNANYYVCIQGGCKARLTVSTRIEDNRKFWLKGEHFHPSSTLITPKSIKGTPDGEFSQLTFCSKTIVSFQDHRYKKYKTSKTTHCMYYSCVALSEGCKARLTARDEERKFWLKGEHTHAPIPYYSKKRFKGDIEGPMSDLKYVDSKKGNSVIEYKGHTFHGTKDFNTNSSTPHQHYCHAAREGCKVILIIYLDKQTFRTSGRHSVHALPSEH